MQIDTQTAINTISKLISERQSEIDALNVALSVLNQTAIPQFEALDQAKAEIAAKNEGITTQIEALKELVS